MTRQASNKLFVTAVMSSAHVAAIGWSFASDPHVSMALVRSSAARMKRYGLVIPPYKTPLLMKILGELLQILSLGVLTIY